MNIVDKIRQAEVKEQKFDTLYEKGTETYNKSKEIIKE